MFSGIGTGCPESLRSPSPFLEVLRTDQIKPSVTWSVAAADPTLSRRLDEMASWALFQTEFSYASMFYYI